MACPFNIQVFLNDVPGAAACTRLKAQECAALSLIQYNRNIEQYTLLLNGKWHICGIIMCLVQQQFIMPILLMQFPMECYQTLNLVKFFYWSGKVCCMHMSQIVSTCYSEILRECMAAFERFWSNFQNSTAHACTATHFIDSQQTPLSPPSPSPPSSYSTWQDHWDMWDIVR